MDHSKGSRVPEVVITCKQKQLMSADNRQAQTIVQQWQNIKKIKQPKQKTAADIFVLCLHQSPIFRTRLGHLSRSYQYSGLSRASKRNLWG